MTYLQFGYKTSSNRLSLFSQAIASFHWPIDCYFSPSDCPSFQAIATFQASDFQSQVYSIDCQFIASDCLCVLADIINRLPSQPNDCLAPPSDCLAFPSDCSLCAVTKRLLLLGKRLLTSRYEFSGFHGNSTCVLHFPYIYEMHEISLSSLQILILSL